MSDKTPEQQAAELASKVSTSKSDNKSQTVQSKSRLLVLCVATVATLAFLGYSMMPSEDKDTLNTSERTSFVKDDGNAFGNLKPVSPAAPIDPNPELLAQIKKLEGELADLKNQPKPIPQEDPRIAELTKILDGLKSDLQRQGDEYHHSLDGKDDQIQRLQNQIDAMRVANGESVDNEAAKQLAAQQALEKRIKSPLNPMGTSNSSGDDAAKLAKDPVSDQRMPSQNELFAQANAKPVPVEQAKVVANPAHTILQGTVIQATLETAINTDLPGMIRAVVSEDVQSLDGSRVLIPRGSKVIGKYSDSVTLGQKRVMVMWNRLLLPNNETVELNAMGSDAIGQAGLGGVVDTHFFQRFGSAALISVIGIAPAVATASLTSNNSDNNSSYNTANTLAAAISQNMQSSVGSAIGDYLKRQPTIGVHQGSLVTLFVDRDLEIL